MATEGPSQIIEFLTVFLSLGSRQVVRQRPLKPPFEGSNPSSPATYSRCTATWHGLEYFMRFLRTTCIGSFLALSLLAPALSFAAPSQEQLADPELRQLYLQQLQEKSPNASLDAAISKARLRVRAQEQQALESMVSVASVSDIDIAATSTTALQKEQGLVDMLQARRQETKVDHDLLQEEEATLDQLMESAKGSALTGALRRKADLYSRRAVFEERLAALDEALGQQNDRLQRLQAQARNAQFQGIMQVVLYAGIFLLIIAAERFMRRRVLVRIRDRNRRYMVVKLFTGAVYLIVIGWALYRLTGDYPGFLTSFAIVGAGVAVALQSIIKDLVGWILILQKRLYRLGHRVTIGPFTGDVADISPLRTTLVEVYNTENADIARIGQTLYLPNSLVLEGPVLNFHATSDFIEAELLVTVTYGSDWKQAEKILREILVEEVGEHVDSARKQFIHRTALFFAPQEPPDPRVFVDIAADGVLFTLRFQIPIGRRRGNTSAISRKILERFAAAKPPIQLAYKTVQMVQ